MATDPIENLIARCVRDLEAKGLVVPGSEPSDSPVPSDASDGRSRGRPGGGAEEIQLHGPVVPVGVSNRHVHLCEADFEALFGTEVARRGLSKMRDLSQPGQFVASEVVSLAGPKGSIHPVRVLGPLRAKTQVEVSRTDAYVLGISPPVRDSGDLDGSAPVVLIGPGGAVNLREGAIIAARHIHMKPVEASRWGLRDGDCVEVKVPGARALVFREVLIRVDEGFQLEMHVDTDEANAALLRSGDFVEIIGGYLASR